MQGDFSKRQGRTAQPYSFQVSINYLLFSLSFEVPKNFIQVSIPETTSMICSKNKSVYIRCVIGSSGMGFMLDI